VDLCKLNALASSLAVRTTRQAAVRFAAIALLLGGIAIVADTPASGDHDIYQQIGRHVFVLDCADIHCFRVLLAPVVEHLPGPSSLANWRAYAVLVNAAAALAIGRLCLILGMSPRAAGLATWIAAFGSGALQSVFDPYTSDPFMYFLAPVIIADLVRDRIARAGWIASIGVLAKEFAAAPLWIAAVAAAIDRRWLKAVRVAAAAVAATLVWLTLQMLLMTLFNYTYGGNKSVDLLSGSYFVVWVHALGWRLAVLYLLVAFGPLLVLMAAGWARCGRTLRLLAAASVPVAMLFMYVQQPDRALWNFHFVVLPIAVLALEALPDRLCWIFIASFGIANLRLGDMQPAAVFWIRGAALGVSLVLAAAAAVRARTRPAATLQDVS
jgi:hypothetical protein